MTQLAALPVFKDPVARRILDDAVRVVGTRKSILNERQSRAAHVAAILSEVHMVSESLIADLTEGDAACDDHLELMREFLSSEDHDAYTLKLLGLVVRTHKSLAN